MIKEIWLRNSLYVSVSSYVWHPFGFIAFKALSYLQCSLHSRATGPRKLELPRAEFFTSSATELRSMAGVQEGSFDLAISIFVFCNLNSIVEVRGSPGDQNCSLSYYCFLKGWKVPWAHDARTMPAVNSKVVWTALHINMLVISWRSHVFQSGYLMQIGYVSFFEESRWSRRLQRYTICWNLGPSSCSMSRTRLNIWGFQTVIQDQAVVNGLTSKTRVNHTQWVRAPFSIMDGLVVDSHFFGESNLLIVKSQ